MPIHLSLNRITADHGAAMAESLRREGAPWARGAPLRPDEDVERTQGIIGPMSWIDSHCHLDAPEFIDGATPVVARARAAGVDGIVIPAVEVANFDAVRTLAQTHGLAYALGIHPLYTDRASDSDLGLVEDALEHLGSDPRLVAVGEIGIDHFVPGLDRDRQERFYAHQLALARRFGLPVILHVRRSADTLLKHLRLTPVVGGIAHAFNGSVQQAHAFIDLGFKLGFGGAMTFERALQLRRLAQGLPLEAIVLETDAPDIPPQWLYRTAADRAERGPGAPNEPAELPRIAHTLAELRGVPQSVIAAVTRDNVLQALPKLAALWAVDTAAPALADGR